MYVKNHMEKWGGKSLRIFVVVVFFYECSAAFNCREVFWKKHVLRIFKINNKQTGVETKSFKKYLWGIHFW